MRLRSYVFSALLLSIAGTALNAQVTLLSEDFNSCQFPANWQVHINGNQNAIYYVTDSIVNNDDTGQSMNGSCFMFIDDDALGDNTPGYVIDILSAPFDASLFPTMELTVDVHYRDWNAVDEYFAILVTDGITETEIARFDKNRSTGDSIWKYQTVKADLSLVTHAPNVRLIFRYDDAGGFDWWAGFDNVLVTGSGTGTNIITETFSGCAKPAGWETQVLTGQADWNFGKDTDPKVAGGNSIDGTCMAFFDDDMLGDSAPYSSVRLFSPWFDGTQFGRYYLDCDLMFRFYQAELATIYVQNDAGQESIVKQWSANEGGPLYTDFVHESLDLSPYRSSKMRVIFEYDDGKKWGWWMGLDNVKIRGEGAANDLCAHSQLLVTGDNCQPANNKTAVLDGPPADCVAKNIAGLWYRWTANFTGPAKLTTGADFNDVVNIYTGGCTNLQQTICNNRDEHGFTGETTWFPAQLGQEYLIRVSGVDGGFGLPRGTLCVRMEHPTSVPALPANDDCANAIPLTVNGPCLPGNNYNAAMSATIPSLDKLARSDVWYTFTAPTLAPGEQLELQSNATFSDIITVYEGGCNNLSELAGNHRGRVLDMTALTAGKTYWAQIAGNFASVEGELCPQLVRKTEIVPPNDNCVNATPVTVGAQCTAGTNANSGFSGLYPPCVPAADRDVWFKFTGPVSGTVRINTGASFDHVLAVWTGSCDSLHPVFCIENPMRCNGYVTVGNLAAGQPYYLQVASNSAVSGSAAGDLCLHILDGNDQPPFVPLSMQVHENCNGQNIAKLIIQTTGGVAPYTYQGAQNGDILASGDGYLIVITDAIGCQTSFVGIVDSCSGNSCTTSASVSATAPSCYGSADGLLSVNVAGGTPPYAYAWSDGPSDPARINVPAGIYTVTVTDLMGCQTTLADTLAGPAQITAIPSSIVQPSVGESNGSIILDITGGSGSFTFVWTKNGAPFSTTKDLINAPAGTYNLVIQDAHNCSVSFNYTLFEVVATATPSTDIFAEVIPNPAKDHAALSVSCQTPTNLYLTLIDASGRVLHSWAVDKVTEQNIPIEVKGLPGGVYQLKVLAGQELLVRKVVVVR